MLHQGVFDFGRVDVDASRDDRFARAPCQEEETILVDIADVPERQGVSPVDLARLLRILPVLHLRPLALDEDAPRRAGAARLVLLVEDRDPGVAHGTPDRARFRKPMMGFADRGRALCPAIRLPDDRAPPVHHLPLELDRCGRSRVRHHSKRRDVVAGADCGGQGKEAMEHRRDQVCVRHPVGLDQPKRLLGIEAVGHDLLVAGIEGAPAEDTRSRVVEGAYDELASIEGSEPERAGEDGALCCPVGGILAGQRAPDALGATRRSGRVEHELTRAPLGRIAIGLVARQLGQLGKSLDFTDRQAMSRVDRATLCKCAPGRVGEAFVGDQHARLGVAEYVRDLLTRQVMIERRDVEARLERGQSRRVRMRVVRKQGRDAIAGFQAECPQAVGEAIGLASDLAEGPRRAVGENQRRAIRFAFRDIPEAQLLERRPRVRLRGGPARGELGGQGRHIAFRIASNRIDDIS